MRTFAILLVLVVGTLATEDIFAELKQTDFGATLTQTILLELENESKDNVGHVVEILKSVRNDLRARAQEAEDSHTEVADACRADFDAFDRKIDRMQADVTKNERLLQIDSPVLDDRRAERAAREVEKGERETALAKLSQENDESVAAFQGVVAEHAAVRTMMHQARSIMEEAFKKDEAFLEVKTTAFSRLSTHIMAFKPLKEVGVSHGYHEIFKIIAQIADRAPVAANTDMVDTILRIFDDIEENLETSLAIEREAERQRLEAFGTLKMRLTDEISGLAQKMVELDGQVLQLQLACTGYHESVEAGTQGVSDAEALKADRQAVCGEEDAVYQYKNSEFQAQITTCGNAIYLLEDKRELLERYNH